jgi:hypothetical protein
MTTGKLYQEALNDANDLVRMAEERARDKLIESVMPRIRSLLEKRILEDKDDSGDDDLLLSVDDDDDDLDDEEGSLDDDGSADEFSGDDEGDFDDLDSSHSLPPIPPAAPAQSAAPAAGSLDIKVPSGVKNITLSVESRRQKDKLVSLSESNIQDLMKLVDGKGTLVERARSIQVELKMLRRELDALSDRKRLRAGDRIVEEFNAILRKAIGLKQEVKDSVRGPVSESAKLEIKKIEKEIKEMSTKTLLRSLLSEGRRGKINEEYEETDMHEADEEGDDAGDEGGEDMDMGDEEAGDEAGGDDAVKDALQSAMDALKQAADAAGVDLGGDDEGGEDMDMGDEPLDDMGDEEEQEEGAVFEFDMSEADEEDLEEAAGCDEDDVEEGKVYEIDESMLRRELKRLRSLREAANGATAMAHHFGGGKAGSDLFEKPAKLNKSDKVTKNETSRGRGRPVKEAEEVEDKDDDKKKDKEQVKESRRNRALVARLNEATTAIKALGRQLDEQKLFNAKLLYVNKLMQSSSLTDKQFRSIVEALDSAKNLREAHLLYSSLSESLSKTGRSLSEGARSAGGSSRPVGTSSTTLNEGVVVDRWALLAGIKK